MKHARRFAVFPLELALFAAVGLLVLAECVCLVLGQACQLVEGPQ